MDPLPPSFPYPPSYLPPYPLHTHLFYLPTILYPYTFSTDFSSHPNAPIHIVYQPCPLPLIFAFLDHFSPPPCYQYPPPLLHIYFNCFPRLSTPCLIHPAPLYLPVPLPPFSLF